MEFIQKLKESFISVMPIVVIVLLLHFFLTPLGSEIFAEFIVGTIFTILGLAIFLRGVDIGVTPLGEQIGAATTKRKNILLMVIVGLVIGVIITISEPSIQVLATQVFNVSGGAVARNSLVFSVAAGVGIFVSLALVRVILQFSLTKALLIGYIFVFIAALFTSPNFISIAFDSGGATTGAMTVPFLLALGMGVSSTRAGKSAEADCFGIIGMASIGPILSLLILGVFIK